VKKLLCMLIIAMVAPLLSGCPGNKGSTAEPPSKFTAIAGDGRVTLTWTPNPGVDYWLFTATDPSLSAFNWTGLANAHAYASVATPFYMCGLFIGTLSNGTLSPMPYYFAANGRSNGGAGGSSSPTITVTPYNASATWTAIPTNGVPSSTNLYGVGYTSLTTCSNSATSATGSFAAVGASGAIFTSNDGQNWTPPTTVPSGLPDLYAVTDYAANLNNPTTPALSWLAVGAGEASVYSTDGITWYDGLTYNPTYPALHSLTHVAGTFLAVGDNGTILSGTVPTTPSSTAGIAWTIYTSTSGTTKNLQGVTHGNIYVAVGDSGTIITSPNGSAWTAQTSVTPGIPSFTLRQVTSNGNIIVAVGDSGTIVTSINGGSTWTAQALPGTPNLVGVAAETQLVANALPDINLNNAIPTSQFVAVDSTGNAYTSVDGITWSTTPISTGISNLSNLGQPMVSSGFGYVAVGNAGATASAF
jgi:hypothetical protein